MTKALSTTEQGVQAVRRVERTVIKRAMRVVERGALDATTIDDDGLPVAKLAEGEQELTGKRLRVARDMRQSKRNAPVYIDVLTRRLEGAEKLDALTDQGQPVHLNIGTVNIVQAPQYESVDVDAKKVDG